MKPLDRIRVSGLTVFSCLFFGQLPNPDKIVGPSLVSRQPTAPILISKELMESCPKEKSLNTPHSNFYFLLESGVVQAFALILFVAAILLSFIRTIKDENNYRLPCTPIIN